MKFEEYWIGKGINLEEIWSVYEQGQGYINKYNSMEVYFLQLTFDQYSLKQPLFNFELIIKTTKFIFHNLKQNNFSQKEYNLTGPLFFYDVCRSSERFRFLGELKPLILFVISICNQIRKGSEEQKANKIKLIDYLQNRFPDNDISDIQDYIDSFPGIDEKDAIKKLYDQGINKIEVSEKPFNGDVKESQNNMISFDLQDKNKL